MRSRSKVIVLPNNQPISESLAATDINDNRQGRQRSRKLNSNGITSVGAASVKGKSPKLKRVVIKVEQPVDSDLVAADKLEVKQELSEASSSLEEEGTSTGRKRTRNSDSGRLSEEAKTRNKQKKKSDAEVKRKKESVKEDNSLVSKPSDNSPLKKESEWSDRKPVKKTVGKKDEVNGKRTESKNQSKKQTRTQLAKSKTSCSEVVVNQETGAGIDKAENCGTVACIADMQAYRQGAAGCARKYVGAHTSIAGGLWKSINETLEIGGRAFALFLKSSRTWKSKPLEESDVERFKSTLQESGLDGKMILPHGSYLMNCGSSSDEVMVKSRDCLLDEVQRCQRLGIQLYNFHPGSTNGKISVDECIERIAACINYTLSRTSGVTIVVENMSGQGNTVGGKFSELRQIIDSVSDQTRIGVCLDTCHVFAAGYDVATEAGYTSMREELLSVVGAKYLKALHLNDSKGELGCHLDRHENIGKGKIGLAAFHRIMNDPLFDDMPLIIETPKPDELSDAREISKLYKMCS